MATTGVGFRWLDILEKEFDKACVELDTSISALDSEDGDLTFGARQKIATLSSCFAQLTHKALTIFQHSAKIEAELVDMRAELVHARAESAGGCQEGGDVPGNVPEAARARAEAAQLARENAALRETVLALHSELYGARYVECGGSANSTPSTSGCFNVEVSIDGDNNFSASSIVSRKHHLREQSEQEKIGRSSKRVCRSLCEEGPQLAVTSSVAASSSSDRLATKYLDKELAGRIQQLQLLGRDMRAELRDSLWAQVEAEILLQRHKTLVRVCRGVSPRPARPPPAPRSRPRTVRVRRSPHLGLGISVTGGREHGVPILISELEAGGPAALTGDLYVGDAILAINDVDLTQACHKEAVQALQSVKGDCALCVQFIATDDDDRLSEDNYRFPLYPEEGSVFGEEPDGSGATPTAPRTPEYNNRPPSEVGSGSDSESRYHIVNMKNMNSMANMTNMNNMASLNNMVNMNTIDSLSLAPISARYSDYATRDYNNINNNLDILDMDDDSIKIEARLEMSPPELAERRRGGYLALAARGSPLGSVGEARARLSSASPHSTPVHQRRPSLKKKRKPQDWRTKGAYRALAPDAVSSDEPLANHDTHEDEDDDAIVIRETYPAIVSASLPKSPPAAEAPPPPPSAAPPCPSPPSPIAPAPLAPPATLANPGAAAAPALPPPAVTTPELEKDSSRGSSELNPYVISPPAAPAVEALPPARPAPPSAPISAPPAEDSNSNKPNGESKPLLRRESKGFRIGSARRVEGAAVNGDPRKARARLLPGRGDPDFGTPV